MIRRLLSWAMCALISVAIWVAVCRLAVLALDSVCRTR